MILSTKKISITILALSLTLMIGCSSATNPSKGSIGNTENQNVAPVTSTDKPATYAPENNPNKPSPVVDQYQNKVLPDILKLAKEGKIINCEFGAKTGIMENVEKKWGKPDKTVWVAAAKGTYITYLKKNVVFGFNKGAQIFEVRSHSKDLGIISIIMIKKYFGTPSYDVKTKTEEVIGYKVSHDYKILFVFPKVSVSGTGQFLDHYSVLYPQGTVNNMAEDPGRQW